MNRSGFFVFRRRWVIHIFGSRIIFRDHYPLTIHKIILYETSRFAGCIFMAFCQEI